MRPLRLEMEGFTAFRERTVVNFEGTDLFVLWGATGSGKSSIIDAMIFALYGSVPRYADTRLVEPVITQGKREAKVCLDFELAGRRYTAARVVRRQRGGGAAVREVRLERCGQTLASSKRELDEHVRQLLGLDFSQFTTCVVLPQGDFARFLHAPNSDRQELLKRLLRMDLYQRIRDLARQRGEEHRHALSRVEGSLEQLTHATQARRSEREARVRGLQALARAVRERQGRLEEMQRQLAQSEQEIARLDGDVEALAAVVAPEALSRLGERARAADALLNQAMADREAAEERRAQAQATRDALGEEGPLHDALARHETLKERRTWLAQRRAAAAPAQSRATAAREALRVAEATLDAATAREARLAREHQAWHLARGLAAGDACPVCLRPVDAPPQHAEPPEQVQVSGAVQTAREAHAAASREAAAAEAGVSAIGDEIAKLTDAIAAAEAALAAVPCADEARARLGAIQAANTSLRAAQQAVRASAEAETQARAAVEQVRRDERAAWSDFDRARDALAALEPPPADRDDLLASWQALEAWAAALAAGRREARQALVRTTGERRAAAMALQAQLAAECEAADAAPRGAETPVDAVTRRLAEANAELRRLEEDMRRRDEHERQRRGLKQAWATADTLARHLRANAFEGWLLQEAFHQLVGGASQRLHQLSSGDYSFLWDEKDHFAIVDHRNADEPRLPRTLSGGETFLASLALALALAEQVAGFAEDGAAPLESMFLDEGFGTLDADSLDTVASVIEDLGAKGRCVGIVTHVRDLAERIPVQYQVTRDASTAHVERVTV